MKTNELNVCDFEEMSSREMKEANGGILPATAIAFGVGFLIGLGIKLWDHYKND